MRRTTTGILGMILVLVTAGFLSAGITTAQDFGPRRGGAFLPQRLLRNLTGITKEQLAQINTLEEEMKATLSSFREERRSLREGLEAEFASGNPDPTTVGSLVISQRQLAQQLRSTQESYRETFLGIFTLEQQEELEEMRNNRRHRRRGPRSGPGGF